ncbi:DUF3450 family protein [Thalassotalea piscium]
MSVFIKIFAMVILIWGCVAQADTVSELEQLVNRWLLTERQISALEQNAIEQKNSMQQSLTLLEAEYQQLNEAKQHQQKNGSELAQKRAEMIAKQAELEQEQQQMKTALKKISQQLISIKVQLPPPLVASWQAAGDLTNKQLETTDRLQICLKQIQLLTEFQQRISIHEMAILHPNGEEVWVTQLYLGASQAWFVSKDNSYVGIGYPDSLGWQWKFDDEINAEQVTNAIAMFKKQKPANWIQLPIIVHNNQLAAHSGMVK